MYTRTLHSTVTGARLAISGARLTVHVVASRRTIPGPAIRGARCTLIAGARLRITIPVPGLPSPAPGLPYIPGGARRTITGTRLTVPRARLAVPGGARRTITGARLATPGTRLTVHVVANRRTVPGHGYHDRTASTVSGASQGRGSPMRTDTSLWAGCR